MLSRYSYLLIIFNIIKFRDIDHLKNINKCLIFIHIIKITVIIIIMSLDTSISNKKNIIFISHATPEDDELAIWLASRLQMAGYEVWIDKSELKGGEEFWDNIQNTLNNETVKFLCILSNVSVNKKGVKDEINYALSIEREHNLTDFVLPILKESVSPMPINIARKNYIGEFTSDWGKGLERVLNFLEKHNAPKENNSISNDIETLIRKQVVKLEQGTETIMSNQFEIKQLPEFIYLYKPIGKIPKTFRYYGHPIRDFGGYLISFYCPEKMQSIITEQELKYTECIGLNEFINVKYKQYASNATQKDVDNIIKTLISKTFDMLFEEKQLKNFRWKHTSDWWFPNNLLSRNKIQFCNYNNEKTYRAMVGKSIQYIWHFCFRYRIRNNNNKFYIEISPRTIYTDKNDNILSSDARLNKLRISRTKNWYNVRWRELLTAFMYWLNNGQDIDIDLGNNNALVCSWKPEFFKSNIIIREDKLNNDEGDLNYEE